MLIRLPRPWDLPPRALTDEVTFRTFHDRRRFLKQAGGALAAGAMLPRAALGAGEDDATLNPNRDGPGKDLPLVESYDALVNAPGFPPRRNPRFRAGRPITDEKIAAEYNNFYEFTTNKLAVWKETRDFAPRPWTIEITGHVHKKTTLDLDDLVKLGFEERAYRFRCVEAWAMAVPWTGVPLRRVLELARPLSKTTHVRFVAFHRPKQARGQREDKNFPWPYYEGLTLAEATHPLTLLATGIYGHALPRQHGAPARLMCPWKYGYKNIKSIVRIELVSERPRTFWNDLQPREYDFAGNVNPKAHHPRWSQARERMIGTGVVHDTRWLNGYARPLARLYKKQPVKAGWDEALPPFHLR